MRKLKLLILKMLFKDELNLLQRKGHRYEQEYHRFEKRTKNLKFENKLDITTMSVAAYNKGKMLAYKEFMELFL